MLAKRIIPCLDVDNGRVKKGVNFINLVDVGNPVEIAASYETQGADEQVFLDITATTEGRGTFKDVISAISKEVFMPLTGERYAYSHGGRKKTERLAYDWAQEAVALGAGELLVTSMDKDGTKSGSDIELYERLGELVQVPIIASGGAGTVDHFVEVFTKTKVTGALAASIFHFGEITIAELKDVLRAHHIPVR